MPKMLYCLALPGTGITKVHLQGQSFFNSPAHVSFLTHTLAREAKDECL